MAGPLLTQIGLRLIADPVGVINDPWQASHPKAEQICHKEMLVERKHVSDFELFLKKIDFS